MSAPDAPFRVGVTRDLRAGADRLRLGTLDELDAAPGVEWHFLEHDGPEADPADVAGVDALLVFAQRVSERSLQAADRLRVLARIGVGYDNVDLGACSRRGILLTTTPDAVRRPMASGALALLLGLAHRIVIKDRLVRAGGWQRRFEHIGEGLQGKTLGLLGFGNIARELSLLARPLELRQIAYTPRLRPADAAAAGVEAVSLEVLLRESDFLVVACPLNDETRGLLDAGRLALMKPTASLVNIARGAVIDEDALADALREGRLAGAALDVFTQEPIDPSNPLLALDQVIVDAPRDRPHRCALPGGARERVAQHPRRGRRPRSRLRGQRRRHRERRLARVAAALEALAQLFAAPLLVARAAAALLDVLAEARFEAVGAATVDALGEMCLDAHARLGRQHAVEVALHGHLGLGTAVDSCLLAHETAPVSRDCASAVFSIRRPRWRRDMTVPIGTSRMSAAS